MNHTYVHEQNVDVPHMAIIATTVHGPDTTEYVNVTPLQNITLHGYNASTLWDSDNGVLTTPALLFSNAN